MMSLPWFLSEIGPAAMLNDQRRGSAAQWNPASSDVVYRKYKTKI